MVVDYKLNSFQELVEVMNLKTRYTELIEDSSISVPKKYKILNTDSARWCIEKLLVFNKKSKAIEELEQVCYNFIDVSSYISLSHIFKQHEQGVLDASPTQKSAA